MRLFSRKLVVLLLNMLFYSNSEAFLPARANLWAFEGTDLLVQGDIMAGLVGNEHHILWGDLQGRYGNHATWTGGVGAGYRQVIHCEQILGAYIFVDDNRSARGNTFFVLSPGIESLGSLWDFRVNGYFPTSSRAKSLGTVFGDEIGINKFVFFRGHQQFNHFFDQTEEVGNGVDGEVGRSFSHLNDARIYLGAYYFDINNDQQSFNESNPLSIRGVSGRLEYPLRPHLSLQIVDTYDNFSHNTFLLGARLAFGANTATSRRSVINERLLDPTSRHLGTQYVGTGIPVVEGRRDRGVNVLERDNIYFFNATQGSVFNPSLGIANGTFENPLIGASFNQATIDAIATFGPITNFYFTPGTYVFEPAPNGRIALHSGQSMWGRTQDYVYPAQGGNRALFIGGIDLFEGNNRLDSIQLLNNAIGPNEIIALHIENAGNVVLFNDDIRAITVGTDLGFVNNLAAGIYGNNSQVIIKDSDISAAAVVNGSSNAFNAATGIGANSDTGTANFVNNEYVIANSRISGYGIINGINNIVNFGSGIGSNTLFGDTNFFTNRFTILNSQINGLAFISGDNNLENFAAGIGSNYANFLVIGTANFEDNTFTIIQSNISGTAQVGGNNAGLFLIRIMPLQAPGSSFNFATGIGSNVRDFIGNTINLVASNVEGNGIIGNTNFLENFVTGLGGNFGNFINNNINLTNSSLNGSTVIGGVNDGFNYVTGMGGNAGLGDGTFLNNSIAIKSSSINGFALMGANLVENLVVGVGGNFASYINNAITITSADISSRALISNVNSGSNFSTGIGSTNGFGTFSNNNIFVSGLDLEVNAITGFNSATGVNQATGVLMNNTIAADTGNQVNIFSSNVNVRAQVLNINNGINTAIGLAAIGAGDVINVFSSIVNTFAIVAPGSSGTNTALPIVEVGGGTVNAFNTNFNVVVLP